MSGHYENHDVFEILRGKCASQIWAENTTLVDYCDYFDEDVSLTEDADYGDVMPSERFYGRAC